MTHYEKTHGISGFPTGFEANRFDRLPPEQLRELSRAGGIASGKARLRKALLRDYAIDMIARQAIEMSAKEEFLEAVSAVVKAEKRKRRKRKPPK